MTTTNRTRRRRRLLGRPLAGACLASVLLAVVAGPAHAGTLIDPTNCFVRSGVDSDRTVDLVNSDPSDGPETGNFIARLDLFTLDVPSCFSTDVYDISVVVKNPFDIPGPDVLSGATFNDLRDQMESDFPAFDHWAGYVPTATGLDPTDVNDLNQNGFHGVSVCLFLGDQVGNSSNLQDCVDGTADRLILTDIDGLGMVFTISLGESSFFLCGECSQQEFELVTIMYSDQYGMTSGIFAHPQAMTGWRFFAVPEPSVLMLLAPVPVLWRARRRRRTG